MFTPRRIGSFWGYGASLAISVCLVGCAGSGQSPNAVSPVPATTTTQPAPVPAASSAVSASTYRDIVEASDRLPEDRALDAGRHPSELLGFLGLRPGMRVAEISAGGGYTTELLARAVAPTGVVYGQNAKVILEKFAEKPWSARLEKPIMKSVVRVDREFDDPLPPEAKDLDLVLDNLFYHDTVWMKTNRDRMNRAILAALRSGGAYVVIDHSGRSGTGTTEAETLHRIEEQVVITEIQNAGFKLAVESEFLRNPADGRDWSASPRVAGEKRGTSDRFALKFVKP
jgi:predicted methyltransferase